MYQNVRQVFYGDAGGSSSVNTKTQGERKLTSPVVAWRGGTLVTALTIGQANFSTISALPAATWRSSCACLQACCQGGQCCSDTCVLPLVHSDQRSEGAGGPSTICWKSCSDTTGEESLPDPCSPVPSDAMFSKM